VAGDQAPATGNKFAQAMAGRTDSELVALLGEPADNWREEALAAARAELATRNFTPAQHEELVATAYKAANKARLPLDTPNRIFAFGFGVSVFLSIGVLFMYTNYAKSGHHRRAKEALAWYLYGLGTMFTLIVFGFLHRC
jgi:hypothetical protein